MDCLWCHLEECPCSLTSVYSAVESIRRCGSDEEKSSTVRQLECACMYGPAPI